MCQRLDDLRQAVGDYAARFDPARLSLADTRHALGQVTAIEHMAATMKALAAARLADAAGAGGHARRVAANDLARATGTSQSRARDLVEVGRRLVAQPEVAGAARQGRLSPAQTSSITDAAAADPSAQRRLLDIATSSSLGELRDECARTKAAAQPDPDRRRADIHAGRRLRNWTDPGGVWHLDGCGLPERGAQLMSALGWRIERLFNEARREGRRESPDAYAFDALIELALDSLSDDDDLDEDDDDDEAVEDQGQDRAAVPDDQDGGGAESQDRVAEDDKRDVGAGGQDGTEVPENRDDGAGGGRHEVEIRENRDVGAGGQDGTEVRENRDDGAGGRDGAASRDDGDGAASSTSGPDWAALREAHARRRAARDRRGPDEAAAGGGILSPEEMDTLRQAHARRRAARAGGHDQTGIASSGGGEDPAALPSGDGDRAVRGDGRDQTAFPTGDGGGHNQTAVPSGDGGRAEPTTGGQHGGGEHGDGVCDGHMNRVARRKARKNKRGRKGAPVKLIIRVDWDAFLRGVACDGEVCELVGYGPVSMAAVNELLDLGDPFVAAILTKGKELVGVAHLGRQPTAHQRSALEWLYPSCAVLGCPNQAHLEIDHRLDWADSHYTMFDLLDRLCRHHHALKTRDGWALVAGTGKRAFVPPDDPRHPNHTRTCR